MRDVVIWLTGGLWEATKILAPAFIASFVYVAAAVASLWFATWMGWTI